MNILLPITPTQNTCLEIDSSEALNYLEKKRKIRTQKNKKASNTRSKSNDEHQPTYNADTKIHTTKLTPAKHLIT